MKNFLSVLSVLLISGCSAVTVFAKPLAPETGDTAAPLVPIFVTLMVIAVIAIFVCLLLTKKKK